MNELNFAWGRLANDSPGTTLCHWIGVKIRFCSNWFQWLNDSNSWIMNSLLHDTHSQYEVEGASCSKIIGSKCPKNGTMSWHPYVSWISSWVGLIAWKNLVQVRSSPVSLLSMPNILTCCRIICDQQKLPTRCTSLRRNIVNIVCW